MGRRRRLHSHVVDVPVLRRWLHEAVVPEEVGRELAVAVEQLVPHRRRRETRGAPREYLEPVGLVDHQPRCNNEGARDEGVREWAF